MSTRRAALDGLSRIMEATALEELFTGSDDDALLMLELLTEAARGRQASCYWEVCRTARRRGVTPEYVGDRASVLLASIEERRRSDIYRILGVAPLADADAIRHRWLEIAKREHPDVGGDPARFRRAKDAYELLKNPQQRAEYERYWLRALGPFERVTPPEDGVPVDAPVTSPRRVVMVGRRGGDVTGEPLGEDVVAPSFAEHGVAASGSSPSSAASLSDRIAEIRAVVARIERAELERVRREVATRIEALEGIRADLATIARVGRLVSH